MMGTNTWRFTTINGFSGILITCFIIMMVMKIIFMLLRRTEKMPVSFSCNCSAERCERGLLLLGEEELSSMIADGKPVSMRCQFCGKEYTFPTSKLEELLEKCRLEENSGQSGEEC